MNNMQVYSKYVISGSLILILSIFTIFSISEVQAAENISVNAKSFENTVIIEFTNQNTPNIKIGLNNPDELGADLIVNASAAYDLTKQRNLVIDHGTALTFCHIDNEGKYLGCLIFPGNHIASQSLAQFTSKLDYYEMKDTNKLYGVNTEDAIGTGLFKGYIHVINGFIKEFKDNYKDIKVIGTGNGVRVFEKYLNLDIYEEDLTFKGLNLFAQSILIN